MRLLGAIWATVMVCQAGTVFTQPTVSYTSSTNLVTFADPDEAMLGSITDGTLTISFSTLMRASTVGDNWSTWGAPPDTESSTPRALWSALDDNFDPITTVLFSFSAPLRTFGMEVEPDSQDTYTVTMTFYSGGVPVDTVVRDVNGNGGALLFALMADPGVTFDAVQVSSTVDWAGGQVRYALAGVPEPSYWFAPGLVLLWAWRRR